MTNKNKAPTTPDNTLLTEDYPVSGALSQQIKDFSKIKEYMENTGVQGTEILISYDEVKTILSALQNAQPASVDVESIIELTSHINAPTGLQGKCCYKTRIATIKDLHQRGLLRGVPEGFVLVNETEYRQLKNIQNAMQGQIDQIAAAKEEG